jgi:hypothetical protein
MTNEAAVDRFTLAHLALGYGLGRIGVSFPISAAIALGWELLERPLKERSPNLFPNPSQDSSPNALMDVGAVLLGHIIARR